MKHNNIDRIKDIYRSTTIPDERVDQLWKALAPRLPTKQDHPYHYVFTRYATSIVVLLVATGTISIAQAAKPNTPLYPVKILSDRIAAKITGRYYVTVEKRAEDVVTTIENNSVQAVEQAAKAYHTSLGDASAEKNVSEANKQSLHKTLERTENKLRSITPADTHREALLRESIQATEHAKQEVKGEKVVEKEEVIKEHPVPQENQRENKQENPEQRENQGKSKKE